MTNREKFIELLQRDTKCLDALDDEDFAESLGGKREGLRYAALFQQFAKRRGYRGVFTASEKDKLIAWLNEDAEKKQPMTNREKFMQYAHKVLDSYDEWDTDTFTAYVSDEWYRWNNVRLWLKNFARENGLNLSSGFFGVDNLAQWLDEPATEQEKGADNDESKNSRQAGIDKTQNGIPREHEKRKERYSGSGR